MNLPVVLLTVVNITEIFNKAIVFVECCFVVLTTDHLGWSNTCYVPKEDLGGGGNTLQPGVRSMWQQYINYKSRLVTVIELTLQFAVFSNWACARPRPTTTWLQFTHCIPW